MSDPLPKPRGGIDFPTLTGHNTPGKQDVGGAEEAEKLLVEHTRLKMLRQLVGSDSQTHFKVEQITSHVPMLKKSISDELKAPLSWPQNACLLAEVMQFRKGKTFVSEPSAKELADLGPGVKVEQAVSAVDRFIIHFCARAPLHHGKRKAAFMNKAGDVMATVDGNGAITSFQILLKSKEDGMQGSSGKRAVHIKFVEGEDFVELLKHASSTVRQKVQETCDAVLLTLLQRGRL